MPALRWQGSWDSLTKIEKQLYKILQQVIINTFERNKNVGSFSKEIEDIMKKQMENLELESIIIEKKKLPQGINSTAE